MPIMQPNDMPLIGLPLDLSDEAATELIDFLYALTEALERHYCGQLLRYAHRNAPGSPPFDDDTGRTSGTTELDDPPF
jgi:hypothetical protein